MFTRTARRTAAALICVSALAGALVVVTQRNGNAQIAPTAMGSGSRPASAAAPSSLRPGARPSQKPITPVAATPSGMHPAPTAPTLTPAVIAPAAHVAAPARLPAPPHAATPTHVSAPTHVSVPTPAAAPTHAAAPVTTPGHRPALGVYAGPDSKGVTGAAAFGAATGVQPSAVLDFAGTDSWFNITAPSWLVVPHAASSARFELSLPMFPDGSQYSLAACASGAYDDQWRKTASNLVSDRLADTIVRPGWEFNGNWYHWSAKNDIGGFVGCFRHIVQTMRSVPRQRFSFDWNPSVGMNAFPAEQAYPGDAYVDYIGVDAYDYSWSRYPASGQALAAARNAAWNDILNGDHGLAFWSRFAASHHKAMAITEWAAAVRTDGHGGGDNAAFIDHMFDFMENPANNVAYAHYFNTNPPTNDHALTGTRLPAAATEYRRRALAAQ